MSRAAWDIEITFDPTYSYRGGRPYIARAYPHGRRTMAYMLEVAATQQEALAQMQARIRDACDAEPGLPTDLVTVPLDENGEIV